MLMPVHELRSRDTGTRNLDNVMTVTRSARYTGTEELVAIPVMVA